MQIRVADNIGFCFGVERAISMAESCADGAKIVYTLGELIHNDEVIKELRDKHIIPAEKIDDIPCGSTVVIRSHGIGKSAYGQCDVRGFNIVDATCPFVKKIHGIVNEHYNNGYSIVILGEPSHPEVMGIAGWCDNTAAFVQTAEDAREYECDGRVCLVSQTTFSSELFDRISSVVLSKYNDAKIFNTLCNTTRARQKEAGQLSGECTQMIVVGNRNSSNTEKLAAACRENCKNIQLISKVSELSLDKLHSNDIIGIVGGASTPNWIIREVITGMSELEMTMAGNPEEEKCEVATEATATVEEPAAAISAADTAEPVENADPNFEEAFEKTLVRIRNGQVLTGSVVQIVDGEVCVNIGYKSDGFIPRSEFSSDTDVNPADVVKIGDEIEVEVLKVNDGEGNVLLSHKNVESKKMWDTLMADDNIQDRIFDAVGREVVKGGLIASIEGVRAFVPASQLSTKYVENIGEFVGKELKLKVIEVDKSRKRIVASHKAVMQAEAEDAKKLIWGQLVVGSKINGVVRRLTDFGAFVDIGGIDGLVHVTDVAWGRVKHPSDVLTIGQEIEVLIRDVDVERQRVSLGYKQLQPKPWTLADQKYPVGVVVEGKVVRIVPFGAFVALEPTIDGLIHISQVGVRRIEKVEDEINVGDIVRCKVLDVNPEAKRISLSRREVLLDENPDLVAELEREREERDRIAAERTEQRASAPEQHQQAPKRRENSAPQNNNERADRAPDRGDRGDRRDRRPRRENTDNYELPPVQQATTSLADLFSGFNSSDSDESK
ncbi:MAG: bifunctional 4-hydroxy-3-methylbut-2-enyl diphosphate reductase/30S ribosomal protein S1 [Clostridia bacterium]